MVKGDPIAIFLVALIIRAVDSGNKEKGCPSATESIADYDTEWVDGGPSVLGRVTQGHSLPFHIQKGKRESDNWDAQGQVGFFRLSFKVLKTVSSSSSHKMGFGLLLLGKTYRGLAIREKFKNPVLVITS